ncbi:F0F1 ATP synthase subunit A [Leifsonia sp. NCR5]|uniref:F0F1 ATP synthase subunit A n=1 Tax=Leifsonia sp. NCR5 TaxID=1978342 RepID=UPI00211A3ECE|nr:F0F1 ATP synthase subunit A [Leifsonia sp. NCR5]
MLPADSGFTGPSINDFFPPALLFVGTPFEVNRVTIIRLIATLAIVLVFGLGTRRLKVVPGRWQSVIELGLDFVRVNIAEDLLGKRDGRRFLPLLTTIFFMVLFFNLTSIIPGLNMAGSAVIGVPLVLAIVTYGTFVYAGIRHSPGGFFRNALFPPGVPWPLYIIVTPIELISTFLVRPVTLILRLMMNMVVGHLLLVLFFSGTEWFIFEAPGLFKLFGVGTLVFAFAFTLMEILVGLLQAYIFTLLTGVYIQLAVADTH